MASKAKKERKGHVFKNKDGDVVIYTGIAAIASHGDKDTLISLEGGGQLVVSGPVEANEAIIHGEVPAE